MVEGFGSKYQTTQWNESNATFVPTYSKSKGDVETAKKHTQRELMVSLLNMQTDTSVSLPTNEPDSVTTICSFAFKHHVTGPRARRNWCYHKYYWCRYLSLHWNMAEWICSRWIFEFKWFPTFRRDHVGWEHGRVWVYVGNSMQCNILSQGSLDQYYLEISPTLLSAWSIIPLAPMTTLWRSISCLLWKV